MNTRANRQQPAAADPQDIADAVTNVASVVVIAPKVEEEQELTLDEFCRRLSSHDRRVELISGFHFSQTRDSAMKATESVFKQRYGDFCNKPV